MAACQDVRKAITQSFLGPIDQWFTDLREKCDQVQRWIEEEISQPVEQWTATLERSCRDLPWWNPVRWFCEFVTILVKTVVWVTVTVGKWTVVTVCQVITVVVKVVVMVVLRTVLWFVTFAVCVVTDFGQAIASVFDIGGILADTLDDLTSLVETLVSDSAGMLEDTDRLLDSIACSLGPLGVLLGPLKGMVQWTRRLAENLRDLLGAIKDIVLGALLGNVCRIERGGTNLGVVAARSIGAATQLIGVIPAGVRDAIDRRVLEARILAAINDKFGAGSVRAARIISAFAIGASPMGPVFVIEPYRMFLGSTSFTRKLHNDGTIDLFALAGYFTPKCPRDLGAPQGDVVYAGTDMRVSFADLNAFLDYGPGAVAPFRVFAITRELFRQHLEYAKRKAAQVGVQFRFAPLGEFEATLPAHVPLAVDQNGPLGDVVQQDIFRALGRNGRNDDLSRIPALSHFHYVPEILENGKSNELFGLTSPWWPSRGRRSASGVTYRNITPDFFSRVVLIHELGHYLGLLHTNPDLTVLRGPDEIMFKLGEGDMFKGSLFYEYLLLGGEPRFTQSDATVVWNWIVNDAESILPS
jgi:hypothetical protein